MNTVKEQLISLADTQSDLDLLELWFEEDRGLPASRQRALEVVRERGRVRELRFGW
ncbi:MAG: hypothetical protein R3E86_12335 [Pseudomonadales bacterium]